MQHCCNVGPIANLVHMPRRIPEKYTKLYFNVFSKTYSIVRMFGTCYSE